MEDQLNFKNNQEIKEKIENEEVLLSLKINKKFLDKLIHKTREINLLITNKSIYNLKKTKIKRKIMLEDLIGVTISNLSDQFIVHGIKNDYDNLYISKERKAIIKTLQSAYKSLTKKDLLFCKKDEEELDNFVVRKSERKKNPDLFKIKDAEFTPIEDYLTENSNNNIQGSSFQSKPVLSSNSEKVQDSQPQNNDIPQAPQPPLQVPDIKAIPSKEKSKKESSQTKAQNINDIVISANVNVEIDSEINELFVKTNVMQQFTNPIDSPIELKIYVHKKKDIVFDSFTSKIGDSIEVKSKVIKKEKAEIKYTDSIASGNAAIFVSEDPDDENRLIINMGNIPPKENVTFISKFINFTEASDKYEFELFRNLPIFKGRHSIYQNTDLKGKIKIKSKNKIINIHKEILMKDLIIKEENMKIRKIITIL